MMRHERLSGAIVAIADSENVEALEALLADLTPKLGFKGAAYYRLTRFGAPVDPTFVFGEGFDEWLQYYAEHN